VKGSLLIMTANG